MNDLWREHNYRESIERNNYTVINCKSCGWWHVHPMPPQDKLNSYYKNKYYETLGNNRSMTDKIDDPDGFYAIQYENRLRYITKVLPSGLSKTIIDIGAGYGDFLSFMRAKGWQVQGIEPSEIACQSRKDETLNIKHVDIDKLLCVDLEPSSLVTLNNILEHLREPYKVLKVIREHLLLPRGILSVIVPNDFNVLQELLMRTILKDNAEQQYYWVVPPDHLNYWSNRTIETFLRRCGFTILESIGDFPMELFLLMGDDYISHPEIGRGVHLKRVRFEKLLYEAHSDEFRDKLFKSFARVGIGRVSLVYATI